MARPATSDGLSRAPPHGLCLSRAAVNGFRTDIDIVARRPYVWPRATASSDSMLLTLASPLAPGGGTRNALWTRVISGLVSILGS